MSEYYDPRFKPSILGVVDEGWLHTIVERLQITPNATPVPSSRRQNVGIWFGQLLSISDDFGVIAVAVDAGVVLTADAGMWFYGTTHQNAILGSPHPFEAMADAANIQVPSPQDALVELSDNFPSEYFPEDENLLEIPDNNSASTAAQPSS